MTHRHYALIGMAAPILFWSTYFIMAGLRPEYSFYTKAISELGSVDAPNKWVWNSLGYGITGLFISVYAYGLFRSVAGNAASKFPLIGLVLSGLFMSLAGIFPGDFDNKQTTTMLLHTIGSFGSYLFFLLAAFTYPKHMNASAYWKQASGSTLLFTWLTILFGAWPFLFPSMPAVGQRFIFLFYFVWIFYTAIKLYRQPSK
ncbi:MAG: DUF998 domain-containing protein [Cyclobacteriaceae bacterium]|nr:DUF998 domain-containing protein [Cyclobacteriaceae bacterium]